MMEIHYPWYAVAACLLVGVLYAFLLYGVGKTTLGRGMRWLLAVLRTLAVTAIALLLLEPTMRRRVVERQPPRVVLAQDVSASVVGSADSAYTLDALAARIEGRCEVVREAFGTATSTNIGEVLSAHRGDADAIVLATDGIHNQGPSPTLLATQAGIPVFAVALGDTSVRCDAALTEVRCNRIAMLGSSLQVEATVLATLLEGKQAQLTLCDSAGRVLSRQPLQYGSNRYAQSVNLTLETERAGLQRFVLNLSATEGELTLENNRAVFYVDVIDTRRRVVIFANAPHPDVAALRASIGSNRGYEAVVVMADEAERPTWHLDGDYSMAVLHNLPSEQHPSVRFADGLPTLFVVGLQTSLPRFNALHTGLEIEARTRRTNEVTASHRADFSLFSLDEDDATAIEALPPLSAPFGEARVAPEVQTLLAARVGNIVSSQPLLAATSQSEHRQAFVWGEGWWRWRLADYAAHQSHELTDRLMDRLVGFTAMQAGRNRLHVEAERTYAEGTPIALRAVLYNESYEVVNDREVNLELRTTAGGEVQEYAFHRDASGYALSLPALPEGLYRYRAHSGDLQAEGTFAVEAINLEQRNLQADHALLRTLAATSGGLVAGPGAEATIADALLQLKPTLHEHTRHTDWLHWPWLLALVVVLLGAEWAVRKYHGEV